MNEKLAEDHDARHDAVIAADDTGMVHAQEILVVEELDGAMPLTGRLEPTEEPA